MTMDVRVRAQFDAEWRRPKGRVRTTGPIFENHDATIPFVDPDEAPIVTTLPLRHEPHYRILDGELWHPLVLEGSYGRDCRFLGLDDFRRFLVDAPLTPNLAVRHPFTWISDGSVFSKGGHYARIDETSPGRFELIKGLRHPFEPKCIPANEVTILSERPNVERMVQIAMTDFAMIGDVAYRRCPGPSLTINGRYLAEKKWSGADSIETTLTNAGMRFVIDGQYHRTPSHHLALPLAMIDENILPIALCDYFRRDAEVTLQIPRQDFLVFGMIGYLAATAQAVGHETVKSLVQFVGDKDEKLESIFHLRQAGLGLASGELDLASFLHELANAPACPSEFAPPGKYDSRSRLQFSNSAVSFASLRRTMARIVLDMIPTNELGTLPRWRCEARQTEFLSSPALNGMTRLHSRDLNPSVVPSDEFTPSPQP